MNEDIKYMQEAILEAKKALLVDEVPVGAIIVKDNKIIARSHNYRETKQNAIYHAEMNVIHEACKILNSWRLDDCILYVTLEPCPMCAGAIIQSRIPKVVFGASDTKSGSVISCNNLFDNKYYNHHPKYSYGILEKECSFLLTNYFKEKRRTKSNI